MTVNIVIRGRQPVDDPEIRDGRKEVMDYAVINDSDVRDILKKYPHTGSGSMAQNITTGTVFHLMGNTPDDWIKMGS